MVYNDDKTWDDIVLELRNPANTLINSMNVSLNQYNEWQSFRAGRDNATIATALSRTTAEIADLDAAYAAFKEVYDFFDNVASPTQGDRFFSVRKFT